LFPFEQHIASHPQRNQTMENRMSAQNWKIPICLSALWLSTVATAAQTISTTHGTAANETPVAALQPVPEALSATAVRRTIDAATARALWNDPAIKNFKGLSENSQDFTDPSGIPGFGPLQAADQPTTK
jgi:hypothetical protein